MEKRSKVISSLIIVIVIIVFILMTINGNKTKKESINKQPDTEISYDLFGNYYSQAEKIVKDMTLEEKVGQLFLVRHDNNLVMEELTNYYPGGYVFFARDFENEDKNSFSEKIENYQSISKVPLIIAVDEEGGIVTRISRFKNFREEKFLSPSDVYNIGGYELLAKTEEEKAKLLLSLGINLNLAPVADVSTDPNDYIYSRSFKKDATMTGEYVKNMVEYANEWGISSSLKHFPGYGNNLDTHTGVAIDNRSYENFLKNDYIPFQEGIQANVPTILFSHNIVNCIDPNYPASLSLAMHKELREKLGFSGIIITDDLAMDAVKSYVSSGEAATLAVNSLNDMIITSDFITMYNEVLTSVKNNKISTSTIDTAVKRIIAWKYAYGLYK